MGHQTDSGYGAADYLIASKRCDILGLEQLLRTGRVVVAVSNLIHALQRERGASNMYLASGGARFAEDLPRLRDESYRMERQFRAALAEIDPRTGCVPGASRLFSRVAYAIRGLEELGAVRGGIEAGEPEPETVIDGFSELIQSLLSVVFEAADSAADPDISRLLVAMFHLMQGKECAGQERAVGAAGFARGGFSQRLVDRLRHLIESQERCFEIFRTFADTRCLAAWEHSGAGETRAEMERLRRRAFASVTGGPADVELSDLWFRETTGRIDSIKVVEDELEASLEALCQEKVAAARSDLDDHTHHIEELAQHPDDGASFAVFMPGGCAAETEAPERLDADCAGPRLGRSLVDLVRSQSVRLQSMGEELEEARAALAERKTIEKAKGLIMRHRGVSEEEAYTFLRQVAMSQSRRLAEVAADTISMSDILKG